MTILDKLIEKKDLNIYIDGRIDHLKKRMIKEMDLANPNRKEMIRQRFRGRMAELEKLKSVVEQGNLKDMAKKYFPGNLKDMGDE